MKVRRSVARWIVVFALCYGVTALDSAPQRQGGGLHSSMPAGYDVIVLEPSGVNLSIMGLVECPELEGAQQVSQGMASRVITSAGAPMHRFPRHFNFRITASLRKTLLDKPVNSLAFAGDPRDLLLKLRFRIKAYHGLEVREVMANSVELIGMPADVPYDERVYRISVDIDEMPITERFIIDVLTPEGELVTHFPFTVL